MGGSEGEPHTPLAFGHVGSGGGQGGAAVAADGGGLPHWVGAGPAVRVDPVGVGGATVGTHRLLVGQPGRHLVLVVVQPEWFAGGRPGAA